MDIDIKTLVTIIDNDPRIDKDDLEAQWQWWTDPDCWAPWEVKERSTKYEDFLSAYLEQKGLVPTQTTDGWTLVPKEDLIW
jgi:hypothetical protein